MKAKKPSRDAAAVSGRESDRPRSRRGATATQPSRTSRTRTGVREAKRTPQDAQPRGRKTTRDARPQRSAPRTTPTTRPVDAPARPKSASQAKARSKARKAKAPKVVRPPLRERLLVRLASIELNPRRLVARVPFVVLVISALGVGLGVTLWLSTDAAERSYSLGSAREVNQALMQQKEALERDVLEAQAAPALAEAARNLGMIPSRDTAHLVQDATGNWIVVGTPKPAEGVPPPPLNAPLPEPAPPAPPAPRVTEPREVPVRLPSAATPLTIPGAAPALMPVAPNTLPGVPNALPALPNAVPVAPEAGAPNAVPVVPNALPAAPLEAPALPNVAPGAEVPHAVSGQFPVPGPVEAQPAPVPGAPA